MPFNGRATDAQAEFATGAGILVDGKNFAFLETSVILDQATGSVRDDY